MGPGVHAARAPLAIADKQRNSRLAMLFRFDTMALLYRIGSDRKLETNQPGKVNHREPATTGTSLLGMAPPERRDQTAWYYRPNTRVKRNLPGLEGGRCGVGAHRSIGPVYFIRGAARRTEPPPPEPARRVDPGELNRRPTGFGDCIRTPRRREGFCEDTQSKYQRGPGMDRGTAEGLLGRQPRGPLRAILSFGPRWPAWEWMFQVFG